MAVGYANSKAVVLAVAKSATAVAKVYADHEVTLGDLKFAPELLGGLKGFAGVKYEDIVAEAKDYDAAEKADLAATFTQYFDLPGDTVEVVIEQGFALVLEALDAVLAFVKIGQKVKVA